MRSPKHPLMWSRTAIVCSLLACKLDTFGVDDGSPMSTGSPVTTGAQTTVTDTVGEPASTSTTDSSGSTSVPPHEAAGLDLGFSRTKRFDFSWTPAPWADFYELWERLPGSDTYAQLGGDLTGTAVSTTMPLHLRFGASYFLRTCDGMGCLDSEPLEIVDSMADAVGYFKASNSDDGDEFGWTVALSADGTTLAVAAWKEDSASVGVDGPQDDETAEVSGAVYVFAREGDEWSQQAYLKASNTEASDLFGISLALSADGDTLVVGAYNEASVNSDQSNNGFPGAGAVYAFRRAGDAWSQTAYLKASNPGAQDGFGWSVALSANGRTLAVGAYEEESDATGVDGDQLDNSALRAGAVYLFAEDAGNWSQTTYLKASNTAFNDHFGGSLALAADGLTLAVGAHGEDSSATGINGDQLNNGFEASGAVYVFVSAMGAWSQQAYIKASNTGMGDTFGTSVALSDDGDTLAVGAPGERSAAVGVDGDQSDDSGLYAGATYVFGRSGEIWTQQAYVKASNNAGSGGFGTALALSSDGSILAVGAPSEAGAAAGVGGDQTDLTISSTGAVYVLTRTEETWSHTSYVKPSNPGYPLNFGQRIALSDDAATLVVGAVYEKSAATGVNGDQTDASLNSAGAVYMY